jgi:hypothetical protein
MATAVADKGAKAGIPPPPRLEEMLKQVVDSHCG